MSDDIHEPWYALAGELAGLYDADPYTHKERLAEDPTAARVWHEVQERWTNYGLPHGASVAELRGKVTAAELAALPEKLLDEIEEDDLFRRLTPEEQASLSLSSFSGSPEQRAAAIARRFARLTARLADADAEGEGAGEDTATPERRGRPSASRPAPGSTGRGGGGDPFATLAEYNRLAAAGKPIPETLSTRAGAALAALRGRGLETIIE